MSNDIQFWSLGLFLAMYHFNTSSAQRPLADSQHSEFGVILNLTQSKLEVSILAMENAARLKHSSSKKAGEPSTTGTWKNTFLRLEQPKPRRQCLPPARATTFAAADALPEHSSLPLAWLAMVAEPCLSQWRLQLVGSVLDARYPGAVPACKLSFDRGSTGPCRAWKLATAVLGSRPTRDHLRSAQVLETCLRRIYCSIVHLMVPKNPPRRARRKAAAVSLCTNLCSLLRLLLLLLLLLRPTTRAHLGTALAATLFSRQALKHEGHCNRCCWIRPPGGLSCATTLSHGSLSTPTPTPTLTDCNPDSFWI
jgi:hypothetical protein